MQSNSLLVRPSIYPFPGEGVEKATVRIVRVLVALEIFEEVHEGAYRAAPIAKAYVTGCPLGDALIHLFVQFVNDLTLAWSLMLICGRQSRRTRTSPCPSP